MRKIRCAQCGEETSGSYVPFCTLCLHNGIADYLRPLLPSNDDSFGDTKHSDEPEVRETTLEEFA